MRALARERDGCRRRRRDDRAAATRCAPTTRSSATTARRRRRIGADVPFVLQDYPLTFSGADDAGGDPPHRAGRTPPA
ncbi:MAG: hypothetical protein MZW92_44520 [Comamonadaceae bacterium]|nr:hypothetical protein [Comamonadaceae bacterium]